MPTPQPTLEKIHFLMYPGDKEEVLKLRSQKKHLLCHIPLRTCHAWSNSRNGISYCVKCGRVDFYVGLTGIIRYMEERGELK